MSINSEEVHGGVVKSFTGDGVMALFGVPVALEDAPLRACHAALLIQRRLAATAPAIATKHGLSPQLRIGINTGPVIVGQVQSGESTSVTALGDAVNLASRIQALCPPGGVVLSEATHRLVQGIVESQAAGAHEIKGKAERQRIYRLTGLRQGAMRFDVALSRGLTPCVGRLAEIKLLEQCLKEAASRVRVADLVGEAGIGKSRLIYEFRNRIPDKGIFNLAGSCSENGQQTAFLPFIEVVRGSFRISAGEDEGQIASKLEKGLTVLGLASEQNLGLLLNLLSLSVPEGALKGLDGVLIGLRTRDLLLRLLQARCQLTPVVLVLEDLHWADSASEELLIRLVSHEDSLPLLILHSRRPEYRPPWIKQSNTTTFALEPLSPAETSQIVGARFRATELPMALSKLITDKAEGNPLFAEEIASYLAERGAVRSAASGVIYEEGAVATTLPSSLRSLLTARVDQLAPNDRTLLQAASVIGRRFAPDVLAAVVGADVQIFARLSAIGPLDVVHPDDKTEDFIFKHVLVRDALYDSLLSGPRKQLHLSVADEIERRSAHRLTEVAETLAYHYGCAESAVKAFRYFAMAARKSLDIYALEEAERHFRRALELAEADPGCVSDSEFTNMLAGFTRLLNLEARVKELTELVERLLPRIEAAGDSGDLVLVLHHFSWALLTRAQFKAAHEISRRSMEAAKRLGDSCSLAYGQSSFVHTSIILSPLPLDSFETFVRNALQLSDRTGDSYLRTWVLFTIAWDYINRGLTREARSYAERVLDAGRAYGDPRGFAVGLWLLGWVDIVEERYQEATSRADECIRAALTPLDRSVGIQIKGLALALSGKVEEGAALLREARSGFLANDWRFNLAGTDLALSVATVLGGAFSQGIRLCEKCIREQEAAGYKSAADWALTLPHRLNPV
ncbi:AAA family ATPase [Bradyrhizobium jicamae]|uniref:ATP-binding protein n=1 Tax=Bradyrhizobium jicamae TaxID=280332 RepID=UPI001BA57E65|nr:AAA family ATPase [Bradyrhizobium jicamae]MBR0939470.1 AAA family ATPase [Bradyrhizobium jicamae]